MTMRSRQWLAGVGVLAASVVGAGAAQAQELKIGIMAVLSGPQAVLGGQLQRRLHARHQARRRQARRARHDSDGAGRRAETRRGGRQGQAADRARQGRLRGRPDLLQHPDGDPQADHGSRRVPDQPQRRPLAARRQGLQPVLLLHLLPERPAAGGARQVRAGQGVQEGLPAGAQLSGRQGHDRRLQEALQRRDRRRGLHAAGSARLLGRAGQDRGRQARRLLRLHAGWHGREPRQAIPPGRARQHSVPVGLHGRRVDAAGPAGCSRRLLLRHDLGAQHRHAARTRSSSPTSRRSTATCLAATPCRPTTPPRSSTAQ